MWKPEHRAVADRRGLRYPSDLTDAEWALISPLIRPAKRGGRPRSGGRPRVEIATRTIDILVEFSDFEEFWGSLTVPVGPAGKAVAQMSPESRARLRSTLQERTPIAADGRVV